MTVEELETSKKRKQTEGEGRDVAKGWKRRNKTAWKYEHRPGRLVMASYPKAEPDKNGPHVRAPLLPFWLSETTFERKKTDPHNPIIQKRSLVPISTHDATETPYGRTLNSRIVFFGCSSIPHRSGTYETGRVEMGRSWFALALSVLTRSPSYWRPLNQINNRIGFQCIK